MILNLKISKVDQIAFLFVKSTHKKKLYKTLEYNLEDFSSNVDWIMMEVHPT